MNCEEALAFLPDHLKGLAMPYSVAGHLASCPACQVEFQELQVFWQALGELEKHSPGPGLRRRSLPRTHPRWGALLATAAAVALLAVGTTLAMTHSRPAGTGAVAGSVAISTDDPGIRTLVTSPLPADRINGLALARPGDPALAGLLLHMVDRDPETQVRLAAVEALYVFAANPDIQARLSEALAHQDRPEVQVALVDLMVGLRERRALESLRNLADQGRLAPATRDRIRAGLQRNTPELL